MSLNPIQLYSQMDCSLNLYQKELQETLIHNCYYFFWHFVPLQLFVLLGALIQQFLLQQNYGLNHLPILLHNFRYPHFHYFLHLRFLYTPQAKVERFQYLLHQYYQDLHQVCQVFYQNLIYQFYLEA